MKPTYVAGFFSCAVLATAAAAFFPHDLTAARLLLLADATLTVLVLFRRVIKNEAVLILYLVISYYVFPFPLVAFFGGLDDLGVTIVQTLSDRGFQFPEDTVLYSNLLIVFKNVLMLACLDIATCPTSWESKGETRTEHWIAIGALVVALVSLRMLVSHAFLEIALYFLAIYLAASIAGRLIQRAGFGLVWGVLVLAIMAAISVSLTRSREPITIVFLYVLLLYARRFTVRSWQVRGLLLLGLCLVVAYAAVREGASPFTNFALVGFEAGGESGILHQIGGHIVGLADRNTLPPELYENVIDKLLRTVPFLTKGEMLADRYVEVFYPTVAESGGGFAYPVVAELFTVAHLPGIIAGAFLTGRLITSLLKKARSTFVLVAFFFIFLGLVRRETVVTAITALSVVAVWFTLRAIIMLLRQATKQPATLVSEAHKRGVSSAPNYGRSLT